MNYDILLYLMEEVNDDHQFRKRLQVTLKTISPGITVETMMNVLSKPIDATCGLVALCEGPMYSRLSVAFSMLDQDDDGGLSRRELWRLLRFV